MKNTIFILLATATIVAGTTFTGCFSPEKKTEIKEARAEDDHQDWHDANQDLLKVEEDANAAVPKPASADEWTSFKVEAEKIIKEHEKRVASYKTKRVKLGNTIDSIYMVNLTLLKQKNKDLRSWLVVYQKEQTDWEIFKREFNQDVDEFEQAFKDFKINNIK